MAPIDGTRARITNLRPMLAVRDLPATVRFYVERLGFNCCGLFGNPPVWAEVERDGVALMFNAPPRARVEVDVPRTSRDYQVYYLNVNDVAALHAEYTARCVAVTNLRVTIYGMKEFEVRDPDDHWPWFGQPSDEPPTVTE